MKKFRLKKTFDGYAIQRKFLFFWINSETDRDGHAIYYSEYEEVKKKLEYLIDSAEWDERIKKIEKEKNELRNKFVPTYIYPPLPDEES
jgi:flagellar motility protein MotE (MotC chaperone)